MNKPESQTPENGHSRYLIVVILLLAAVVRFAFISRESLWFDELYNVWANRMPFTDMLREQVAGGHPPLYYIVVRAWYAFGTGEAWVRSFSALAGVATVFFTYLAGKELFSRRAGLWAAAFTALSPLLVMYSRANTFYSLMIALTALSFWLLVRASLRSGWVNWAAYTAAAAAVMMSYFFGAVMVGAGWLVFWIIRNREDSKLTPWIASQSLLLAVTAGSFLLSKEAISEPSRLAIPSAGRLLAFFYMLAVSPFVLVAGRIDPSIVFSGTESKPVSHVAALGVVVIALVLAFVFSGRLRELLLTKETIALAIYVVLMMAGPQLLQMINGGRLSSRFYVWAVPAFMLLVGAVVAAIPRRIGIALGGIFLAALFSFSFIEVQYKDSGDADWRALMGTVADNQVEGDLLVSFPMHNGQLAASYYLPQQLPIVGGMLSQSSDAIYFMQPGETWGGYKSGYWVGSGAEPPLSGVEQEERIKMDIAGADRLWLVSEQDMLSKFPGVKRVLDEGWVEKGRWDYAPFVLILYEPRPGLVDQMPS
ncbi:MAG: glycosyltransferase family 39 protein [Actinobacteria bacterium]|nr:glycosyltransferase family 39 protein [Actinomycetota bacterium]